jgi:cysteine desulfurase
MIPEVDGEALLAALQRSALCVSSGSACTSANPEPSHVLKAIGLSDRDAKASLRFGLGRKTSENEIFRAIEILTGCLRTL